MMKISSLFMTITFCLMFSCGIAKKTDIGSASLIKIIDRSGKPIEGVTLDVEIWIYELYDKYITDSKGLVLLPEKYLGKRARIYKNNYFSQWISLEPGIFILQRAPRTFLEVGSIEGEPIKLDNKHIITITHLGKCYVYSYDSENLIRKAAIELPGWSRHYWQGLLGDSLWYSVADDGVYIYNLTDPLSIVQTDHLPLEGRLSNMAIWDSALVFESFDKDKGMFLHFCKYSAETGIAELNLVKTVYTDISHSVSGYLIKRDEQGMTTVIDYRDPRNIDTVFNDCLFEGCSAHFQGDTLILKQTVRFGNDICGFTHYLVDFANPADPDTCGVIKDRGRVNYIVDKSTIICSYESGSYDLTIKRAKSPGIYETIAIISEQGDFYFNYPPYLVTDRKVWRLLDPTN